jgi:hypothetical protein
MTKITDELIQAAAADQYQPLIPEEGQRQEGQQQRWSGAEWLEHPKLRQWVEGALAAKAGEGWEEARIGGAGISMEDMENEGGLKRSE